MKEKITAKVIKDPRSTIDQGRLAFSTIPDVEPNSEILRIAEVSQRLDREIARYVRYIYTNNYGFYKAPSKKPNTLIRLELLLFIKYGKKIDVEI